MNGLNPFLTPSLISFGHDPTISPAKSITVGKGAYFKAYFSGKYIAATASAAPSSIGNRKATLFLKSFLKSLIALISLS